MLHRITDFSSSRRGKWIVIAIWLVLAAVVVPLAPSLSEVTNNDSSTFLPNDAETTEVDRLVEERFPSDTTPAILVFHNPDGLTEDQKAFAKTLGEWAASDDAPENIDAGGIVSIYTVPQAAQGLVSADGTTMTMIVGVTGDPNSDAYLDAIRAIRHEADAAPDGVDVDVSGPGGLILDLISVFSQIDVFLTAVTAALVLVLLIVIYRSPIVALVPLLAVGWVFTLAGSVAAAASEQLGFLVNGQAQGITTVLLFGAGTDYCLFIASRYKEELRRYRDPHEAMRVTMRAVGESIASSAGTVLVATLILSFATLRSTAALGPLLSIAIGLMLVAGLTLVPALMTVFGRFAFWPFAPAYEPGEIDHAHETAHGIWGRIATAVTNRPGAWLAGSVGVFLLLSLGLTQYKVTYDSISSLPAGTEAREGFEELRGAFPAGESAPVEVYVVLDDGASVFDNLQAIDAVTRRLAAYEGVAFVESVTAPLGTDGPIAFDQVAAAVQQVPQPIREAIDSGQGERPQGTEGQGNEEMAQAIGTYALTADYRSPDNGVARFDVILADNPYALDQIDQIGDFRGFARQAANEAGLSGHVLVGGETATDYDTKQANESDRAFIIPAILVAIGLILALLLRSAVAPLYLLATIALSYLTTLGISSLLFTTVFGYDSVGSSVALYLFVFLVALGVDYNIYLMARIREETEQQTLHDGVRVALSRTGGVITSAGIILAGTFSALMLLPLRDLFQVGFAVALGVLLDTFVVRSVMVPAIVTLLGHWNWWPSQRSRSVPAAREEQAPTA
jgi:uncharacterized membrane protein YdfJ with MMPL/SSD domain